VANLEAAYRAVGGLTARLGPLVFAMRERAGAFYDREIVPRAARLSRRQWQAIAITSVALLHAVFIWMIVLSLRPTATRQAPREMQLSLIRDTQTAQLPNVAIADPDVPVVAPPDVVIQDDQPSTDTIAAASPSQVLAPRPDPSRTNPQLQASSIGQSIATAVSVVLKILVMPDGSIGDATVMRSSGRVEIDSGAIAYVRTNWHFLPALLNGAAIKYWTTVSVPIQPAG
jgi:TonB family protein